MQNITEQSFENVNYTESAIIDRLSGNNCTHCTGTLTKKVFEDELVVVPGFKNASMAFNKIVGVQCEGCNRKTFDIGVIHKAIRDGVPVIDGPIDS